MIICGSVLLAYLPAMKLQWIWDDDQYITQNVLLEDTEGLYRIWFEPTASPQYYPVVFTTLWLERQLFDLTPSMFHFVNVVIHATAAVLCYRILLELGLRYAFWIALAFGLHPIQVESVAWVTEIKNVLSALFYGSAWIAIWKSLSPQAENSEPLRYRSYALGVVFFLSALASKSVTATLPAGMLLAIWFLRGNFRKREIFLLGPLLFLGAVIGWNTARLEKLHVGATGADWDYGFLDRCGIAARCILHYLTQIVAPLEQIFFYPRFPTEFSNTRTVISAILVLCLIIGTILMAFRGRRGPFAGLAFFLGSAFPALGFLNVYPHRFSFVADHFVYIPSLGMLAILMTGLASLSEKLQQPYRSERPPMFLGLPALTCGLYAVLTAIYLPVFTNEITLWEDTLQKNPTNAAAMQNLGLQYLQEDRVEDAVSILERAREIDFDRHQTLNSLGNAYIAQGKLDAARAAYLESARINPDNDQPWRNLAILFRNDPNLSFEESREQSRQAYERAWNIEPSYIAAFGAGISSLELEDYESAIDWFSKATEEDPSDLDAPYNRIVSLIELARYHEAEEELQRLIKKFGPLEDLRMLQTRIRSSR